MGYTRKEREALDRVQYDPELGYQVWPQPNLSYSRVTTQPIIRQNVDDGPELNRDTLLGTCMFLLVLLLVGFVAGYALRGNAYAGAAENSLSSLSMSAVPAAVDVEDVNSRRAVVASFGTHAPDELVALDRSSEGQLTALLRVHGAASAQDDQLSLVSVGADGNVTELLRQNAGDVQTVDFAKYAGDQIVLATGQGGALNIRALAADGSNVWSRQVMKAVDHKADLRVLAMSNGTAIAGPGETTNRIGLMFLGANGELLWQRSFVADTVFPDVWMEAGPDGSMYLAAHSRAVTQNSAEYMVAHIDRNGQDIWRGAHIVSNEARISGLAASPDGQVYALFTGDKTTLMQFDVLGDVAFSTDLPQARFFNTIDLTATPDNTAVVAVSYALSGQHLDVLIEEHGSQGQVIGEMSFSMPGTTSIEAFEHGRDGYFVFGGSILPDRFDDADIVISEVAYEPFAPMSTPAIAVAASAEPALPEQDLAEVAEPSVDQAAAADEALEPIAVASLESSQARDGSLDAQTSSTDTEVAVVPADQSADSTITLAAIDSPVSDDTGAAISRFVNIETLITPENVMLVEADASLQAQCRFSCLELDDPASSFPMWRAIEAPPGAFSAGLPEVHELTCRAAKGMRNTSVRPDCTPS